MTLATRPDGRRSSLRVGASEVVARRFSAIRRLGVLTAATLAVAGCSTLENMNPFASTKNAPKMAELSPIQATVAVKMLWQAGVGKSGDFALQPAVVGSTAYAAGTDGTVARLDEGRQAWRINVGQTISGGVGADERIVVIGTPKGEVIALAAADGKELWKARVTGEVLAPPAIGEGLVVVRSGDNRLFGFEAGDGKRKWVYQRTGQPLSVRTAAAPVIDQKFVFSGFPGGKLVAVSTSNGAAVWEGTVSIPKGATELDRVSDIVSPPVIGARGVCAVAFQGRLTCFDLANGNTLWSRDISSSAGIAMDSRNVYVTDDKSAVHAFDLRAGSSLWKQDKLALRQLTAPIVRRGLVVVADAKGVVHYLNREDGQFVARANTDGSAVVAAPRPLAGAALIQTKDGGLFAIDTE